jgi:cadmium resistance protein CadD (predicted permease)
MLEFFSLLGLGISAFIASNVDDTFILILLFSTLNFHTRHIIVGQFVGIGVLVTVSALGALIALVLPAQFIGIMGFIPMIIGLLRLVEFKDKNRISNENKPPHGSKNEGLIPYLAVSGITIANGGDDLGVFTPLFARFNTIGEVTILVSLFMSMTLVWCMVTQYLTNHPVIAARIKHYGYILTPFVLIGIGVYILTDAFLI